MFDLRPWEEYLTAEGFPPSSTASRGVLSFLEDLYKRNQVMNLTRVPEHDAVVKHLLDSVLPVSMFQEGSHVLDLGTGPGLPSVPIAFARPDLSVVAMDSGAKGLRLIQDHAPQNLTVRQHRAEDVSHREQFDLVIGRAIAPFAIQLELSAAWVRKEGWIIPYRTPADLAAVEAFPAHELGLELEDIREITLPDTEVVRLFPVFVKSRATPSHFPRTWAQIRNSPLGPGG
ncbi:MAG: class I SAM-dependent methyltransferase [Fimbriimonadaceae bacterium]|nr:class I SAM-dependent methyltransferase [Fimbriimonadaceae bacterium]